MIPVFEAPLACLPCVFSVPRHVDDEEDQVVVQCELRLAGPSDQLP